MKIIDIHTHAFPEKIVDGAMAYLETEANTKAALDGRVSSLLKSMDQAKITLAVVSSIATKPGQFSSILAWSASIQSDRIVPFPSVHPKDKDLLQHLEEVYTRGFKGIKLHPYYQDFVINEKSVHPLYKKAQELGLVILFHTGFDIAFERKRLADPQKVLDLKESFPDLKLIASHMGGWQDWREAEKYLIGREIYIDVSYSLDDPQNDRVLQLLENHPAKYILFGSDSPWADQKETVQLLKNTGLDNTRLARIFYINACELLGLDKAST